MHLFEVWLRRLISFVSLLASAQVAFTCRSYIYITVFYILLSLSGEIHYDAVYAWFNLPPVLSVLTQQFELNISS